MLEKEMMKREFLLILIILLIGSIVFPFMIIKNYETYNKPEIHMSIIQTLVLFWTAVIILCYTLETTRLRRVAQEQVAETQRQTKIQLRPFVIVEVGNFGEASISDIYRIYPNEEEFIPPSPPPYKYKFRIRNVGNGTAINIRIRDREDKTDTDTIEYFPIVIPVLCPGEKRNLYHEPYESIDPLKSTFVCTVRIDFENVEGGKYFTEEKIVGGQLEIIDSGQL